MFNSAPNSRQLRRRQQNFDWDHSFMYQSELAPISSFEDLTLPSFDSVRAPTDLPSRVQALNRRAAIVSANLAHLTTVVKPLETIKPEELSDNHLHDMWQEGENLGHAMDEFKEQMEEVSLILQELLMSRRKKMVGGMGIEGMRGGSGRGLMGRRPRLF
jgi:hypothetical protein